MDSVNVFLVKQHGDLLALHITCLINASLRDGVFPDCLKLAYVTPVLKKSSLDHNDLANYRPVSNLPFLAKVTEKIVASRLTAYLQGNDLHECLQSAYRKNHSVETALLKVSDDILTSIDCRKAAALVLLDLSAAFDTIDHAVLLERLREDFGIEATALQWFESYLNDRRQAVVINGKLSPETTLSYGVPQGSVLGPLLFTLYITPLGSIIQRHGLSAHFYADDTQLYLTFDPKVGGAEERAAAAISAAIEEIRCWMRRNFLKLNEKKTEYLLLSSPHMGNKITGTPILVGEEAVSPNNKARNLGVVFDRTMSMKDHISRVCQSAFYHLRRIAEIRHCLTRSAAENLIHALITSRLDFCNSLLVGLPSSAIKRLQAVQNAAARLLMGIRKITERANPYFALQRRKGHGGGGLTSLVIGTLDSVLDNKSAPYRILHQTPQSELYHTIATALHKKDIIKHWEWIEQNLMVTLDNFEADEDVTEFVKCKIESLVANVETATPTETKEDEESKRFKAASDKWRRLFNIPEDEKLVNSIADTILRAQITLLYSFLMDRVSSRSGGPEVTHLERSNSILFPESIRAKTREGHSYFSMFVHPEETFQLMQQLANLAMRQLLSEEGFSEDLNLPDRSKVKKKAPKKVSSLKRDLDARARTEAYRRVFRLPVGEKLDGNIPCTLWAPYNKSNIGGTMYLSRNYICFASRSVLMIVSARVPFL
eukprot:XP_011673671.1 PREDICTED: uncharacterized protein LOC100891953 [Strongylocentrotus purpuratus]